MSNQILVGTINYKSTKETINLIEQLKKIKDVDLMVVNNDEDTELDSYLSEDELIQNGENLGFTVATNQLLEVFLKGDWEYIALINNDVKILNVDMFDLLKYCLDVNPNFGCILPEDAIIGSNVEDRKHQYPKEKYGITDEGMMYFGMFPRQTILDVGMFDEQFFLHCSDSDYQIRIRLSNKLVAYFNSDLNLMQHISHVSSSKLKNGIDIVKEDNVKFKKKYNLSVEQTKTFDVKSLFGDSKLMFNVPLFDVEEKYRYFIPFIFYLVEKFNPNLIVNVGINNCLLFSFAQAIKKLDRETRLVGIDTLENHTDISKDYLFDYNGFALDNFVEIVNQNDEEYLKGFQSESIDILLVNNTDSHIILAKKINTWMSKMSKNSILILPNTKDIKYSNQEIYFDLHEFNETFEFVNYPGFGLIFKGNSFQEFTNFFKSMNVNNVHIQTVFKILSEK
jgi:hypothetical protein